MAAIGSVFLLAVMLLLAPPEGRIPTAVNDLAQFGAAALGGIACLRAARRPTPMPELGAPVGRTAEAAEALEALGIAPRSREQVLAEIETRFEGVRARMAA